MPSIHLIFVLSQNTLLKACVERQWEMSLQHQQISDSIV